MKSLAALHLRRHAGLQTPTRFFWPSAWAARHVPVGHNFVSGIRGSRFEDKQSASYGRNHHSDHHFRVSGLFPYNSGTLAVPLAAMIANALVICLLDRFVYEKLRAQIGSGKKISTAIFCVITAIVAVTSRWVHPSPEAGPPTAIPSPARFIPMPVPIHFKCSPTAMCRPWSHRKTKKKPDAYLYHSL